MIDWDWVFLKVSTVVRPCDGTPRMVRGNRRKAVFAFWGLLSKGYLSCFRLMIVGFLIVVFGSAGKNRNLPSTTRFFATKPQVASAQNRCLVGRSRFYPALPESLHGSMRQISVSTSTPPFSRKETAGRGVEASRCARQVLNLPHTSGFCSCGRACSLISSAR